VSRRKARAQDVEAELPPARKAKAPVAPVKATRSPKAKPSANDWPAV
jgi:hypothetical protein